jgi:hypothetical protein
MAFQRCYGEIESVSFPFHFRYDSSRIQGALLWFAARRPRLPSLALSAPWVRPRKSSEDHPRHLMWEGACGTQVKATSDRIDEFALTNHPQLEWTKSVFRRRPNAAHRGPGPRQFGPQ